MSGPTCNPAAGARAASAERRQNAGKASRLPCRKRSRRFRPVKEEKNFFIGTFSDDDVGAIVSQATPCHREKGPGKRANGGLVWYIINSQQELLVQGKGVFHGPFHARQSMCIHGLRRMGAVSQSNCPGRHGGGFQRQCSSGGR